MTTKYISDEILAAFIDGNISPMEGVAVMESLTADGGLAEQFSIASLAANLTEDDTPITVFRRPDIAACRMIQQSVRDEKCVIACEQFVMSKLGVGVDFEDLCDLAIEQGWHIEGEGTPMENVGNICEHFDLVTLRIENATLEQLHVATEDLGEVIVCLDGGELVSEPVWERFQDEFIGEIPDHALIVVGFDADEVIVCDGATETHYDRYPISQFLDAWADSGNYMVIVKNR